MGPPHIFKGQGEGALAPRGDEVWRPFRAQSPCFSAATEVLEVDDQGAVRRPDSRPLASLRFLRNPRGTEEQRAHQAGFFRIIAWRRHWATSTLVLVVGAVFEVDDAAIRLRFRFADAFDFRFSTPHRVGRGRSGWGNTVRPSMPRFATVVPSVVSCTDMPIMEAQREKRIGPAAFPHSDFSA